MICKQTIITLAMCFVATCWAQKAFEGYDYCAPQGASGLKVKRFEETYICVTINGMQRAIFNPKADDYSLLNIQDSQNSLPSGSGIIAKNEGFVSNATCANSSLSDFFVTIEVSSLGATQVVPYIYQKRSCDGSAKFFPFMTAIIFVEDGEVQTITYDEECAFCNGKSNCQANGFDKSRNDTFSSDVYVECGYSPDECSNLAGGGADCDLRVYVAWVGTDANGEFFTSGNSRFSRFRQFSIGSLFDAAQKEVTAGANEAKKAGGEAEKIPGQVL